MVRLLSIIGISLCIGSCAPKIVQFTNDNARFSTYQSFTVVNYKFSSGDLSPEGTEIMGSIHELIHAAMIHRGYVPDSQEPDLLIRFELISNQMTETSVASSPYTMRSFYYPNQYFRTRTYLESALLIEINDRTNKKLVWQASVDLNKYTRKDKDQEILQKAVNQLFNTYLYRAGTNKPDETLIVE